MSNETSVSGNATLDTCKMQAAYLSKLIYQRPAGTKGFLTNFPKEIEKAAENWEEWLDFNTQDVNGLVQRLYKPKGYQSDAKNDEAMCWPALIHRGTDFDDFRGLGYAVSLHWPEFVDALKNWKQRMIEHFKEDERKQAERQKKFDQMPNVDAYYAGAGAIIVESIILSKDAQYPKNWLTSRVFNSFEFDFIDGYIFKIEKWLDAKEGEDSQIDWTEAKIVKEKTITGLAKGVFSEIGGNPKLEVKIVTRPDGPQGDWATNFLQGVGQIPDAYELAMKNALTVITDYIEPTQDQRLLIAGHSLGGGLATAADCVFRYYANDNRMQNYTIVFNPAGIHENTRKRAKEIAEEGKKQNANNKPTNTEEKPAKEGPNIHDALIDIFHVNDEILTTLEWLPEQIPFVKGVLNILNEKFPEPQGNRFALEHLQLGNSHKDLSDARQHEKMDFVSLSSPYYSPPRTPRSRLFPINKYESASKYNNFKDTLSISNILNKYSDLGSGFGDAFTQFLSDLVDYFDKEYCGGSLRKFLTNLNKDDKAGWESFSNMSNDNFWGILSLKLSVLPSGDNIIGSIRKEIDGLAEILGWSVEFHGMDYVIAGMKKQFNIK